MTCPCSDLTCPLAFGCHASKIWSWASKIWSLDNPPCKPIPSLRGNIRISYTQGVYTQRVRPFLFWSMWPKEVLSLIKWLSTFLHKNTTKVSTAKFIEIFRKNLWESVPTCLHCMHVGHYIGLGAMWQQQLWIYSLIYPQLVKLYLLCVCTVSKAILALQIKYGIFCCSHWGMGWVYTDDCPETWCYLPKNRSYLSHGWRLEGKLDLIEGK